MFFLFFNHRWIRRAVKGPTTRGIWGHAPPENFEILVLWNAILKLLWISLSAKYTLCGVIVIENFRTTVEIWNFPIPNAYQSGFGTVFEQNWKDPDEIRMIKASSQPYYFLWPHLCLTRLNEFRFFLAYFLHTSFKFSSMQSVGCALKTR